MVMNRCMVNRYISMKTKSFMAGTNWHLPNKQQTNKEEKCACLVDDKSQHRMYCQARETDLFRVTGSEIYRLYYRGRTL